MTETGGLQPPACPSHIGRNRCLCFRSAARVFAFSSLRVALAAFTSGVKYRRGHKTASAAMMLF